VGSVPVRGLRALVSGVCEVIVARADALPPIFAQYASRVRYVQRVSQREWSSTCPACGGEVHRDRSLPDRCRWFVDEHPVGWCRRCGALFFPDGAKSAMSAEAFETWRRQQVEREEARRRSAERALAHLQSERIWLRYHEALDEQSRALWRKRGIPDCWQGYWQLGWRREWQFRQDDGHTHVTPSLTIPLFDRNWNCLNVKHRLLAPPPDRPNMRYLYELGGQNESDPLFLCNPDAALEGHVIAVEGEIKSAVTFLTLDDSRVVMVGLPGATPRPATLQQLEKAERITLVLDPGAEQQAEKLAGALGPKRCRILIPPAKIDDGIISEHLTRRDVLALLRTAVPAA